MKAIWTLALVTLMAGCGLAPQTTISGPSSGSLEAAGRFSSFKESLYPQAVSMQELLRLQSDDAFNRANAGKRFHTVGQLNYSIGDMQLVDNNDVFLKLSAGDRYTTIHRENFLIRSKAEAFVLKVGAHFAGDSTVYFTVKTGNRNTRIRVDAIKRPDETLIKL